MRIIKFRGLTDEHVWVYGWFTDDDLSPDIIDGMSTRHKVLSKTVGQYTGLKDHKGCEIFEGDIVKVVSYGEESFHVVKYMIDLDYPAFDLEPAMDGDFNSLSYCMIGIDTKITVIGNIHDNPELLRLTKK